MGKKVKIITNDPILSKNYKYEKRSKTRQIQKLQSQQEKAVQLKRKKEMLQIERKVDSRIQNATSNLPGLLKKNRLAQMKKQMLDKKDNQEREKMKVKSRVPDIKLSTSSSVQDFYEYHFGLNVQQGMITRERKQTKNEKIQEATKKQIREMFNVQEDKQQQEEIQQEKSEELINLSLQCKKQSEICINSHHFNASKNFFNHKKILACSNQSHDDQTLGLAKSYIEGYFDHVFIENSQEEKIELFRKIVINHSISHLSRTLKEKMGGFTNCKILILTPFMGDARAILDIIDEKLSEYEVVGKQKSDQLEDENDFFRVGLKISQKKKQLLYYSNFDHSDIIIASPVGLKSIIGSEGDEKRENSFISSVEIVYIDRASALLMQNWTHLNEIFNNMNLMPKCLINSIDDIRESFKELKGRLYRQNIVFSEFNFPELNSLKKNHMHNAQGGITSKVFYKKLAQLSSEYQKNFYKIELKEPKDDLNIRFDYFKRKFWDDLHNKETMTKVVIFTNSYFQYVKLKSFLEKVNASAEFICEHTQKNKVQSRMARFNQGQFRILLTTQRAFYFEVCQIKKFHSIYFYSLPKNSFIYSNLVNSVQENEMGVNKIVSIYTKFDFMIVERIVGTAKALEMARDYCNNVSFVI